MAIEFDDSRLRTETTAFSHDLWDVPQFRPHQLKAVATLLNPRTANQAIHVDGIGAGKSYAMCVLGSLLGGSILIFIPLLVLSADVMEKFKSDNALYGEITVSHLDELFDVNRDQYLRQGP